ncbi:tRNA pseudouridine(55) synthase TruB [Streptomyces sp. 3MP-14]|uniref:tRNA pseudouridine synthase B n=1 Tax=Streptomyces mimosae TaxID=2586635 RepID=A0A5N6A0W9_9ACTN|nr:MULTISPECIES: tRNA pseudouridine(55) synthase TruB [Streptomyces]KAB8161639.1 tRNA pseudouridine(55) synthase TruB [Streptomyces mimosae]KAB8173424.1 tRNA pseudouridine(55) synthase TruB [Streptomyces sp. 3MP-14]
MSRRGTAGGPDGLLVVDKPPGHTSHDVVAVVRGIARTRRVGHAGTLDPMATGVLLLGLGRATRLLGHLALTEKEYLATVRLGQSTVTDDAEGEVTAAPGAVGLTAGAVAAEAGRLTGALMQVPASVSAVKIDGKRSYRRVRDGEDVDIPARPVTVHAFEVGEPNALTAPDGTPVVDVPARVVCSSGTYVRALARDLGAALGCGGHLTALRRTRVGPYGLDAARTLDQLRSELAPLTLAEAAGAAFPRWDVDARQATLLGNGARIAAPELPKGPVAAFDPDGRLIALVEADGERSRSLAVFV